VTRRALIVNADDLGMSAAVNAGIFRAHDEGIVTSASLMVHRPGARDAAQGVARRPGLSLGLHLDLGEWRFVDWTWVLHDEVVPPDDAEAVAAEIDRQLEVFVDLVGAPPTHLDSHQHVHRSEPVRSALLARADALGVPLRESHPEVRHVGSFYGQWGTGEPLPDAITPAALTALLAELPEGITELGCHPGLDPALDSPYRDERLTEVATLCAPETRAAVRRLGIELRSFHPPPLLQEGTA
jgi:chitin disaccharide deacetylase